MQPESKPRETRTLRRVGLVLLAIVIVIAGAWVWRTKYGNQDSGGSGSDSVVAFDYDTGTVTIPAAADPDTPMVPAGETEAKLRGHVVAPRADAGAQSPQNADGSQNADIADITAAAENADSVDAARPVVVFLHGYFDYCQAPDGEPVSEWPCPEGNTLIESFRGFKEQQEALAEQGFVTVSIDANDVTAQDNSLTDEGLPGRATLVRATLDALAKGLPDAPADLPELDMQRVMLVGHSRGGMGVAQAALETAEADPWRIAGIAYVAPTNTLRLATPTIPSVAFLPTCDGDVTALEGQLYVDGAARYGAGSALHSSLILQGGVHNFFNTEWTPGLSAGKGTDDGEHTMCEADSRISPEAQRAAFTDYLTIAAKAFLTQDAGAAAILDGSAAAGVSSADRVTVVPSGGNITTLFNARGAVDEAATGTAPTAATPTAATPTGSAKWCSGSECRTELEAASAPHWTTGDSRDGLALVVPLDGSGGGGATFDPQPLAAGDAVEARVVVRGDADAAFRVTLLDEGGAALPGMDPTEFKLPRLGVHPGTEQGTFGRDLAQLVRIPVPDAAVGQQIAGLLIEDAAAADTADAGTGSKNTSTTNTSTENSSTTNSSSASVGRSLAILDAAVRHADALPGVQASLPQATIAVPAELVVPEAQTAASGTATEFPVTLTIVGELAAPARVAIAADTGEEGIRITWVTVQPGQREVTVPITLPPRDADEGIDVTGEDAADTTGEASADPAGDDAADPTVDTIGNTTADSAGVDEFPAEAGPRTLFYLLETRGPLVVTHAPLRVTG